MNIIALSEILKELASENDVYHQAHEAVKELIQVKEDQEKVINHVRTSLISTFDKAFASKIDLNSDSVKQDLEDLYLNLGIHRLQITELQRMLKIKRCDNASSTISHSSFESSKRSIKEKS